VSTGPKLRHTTKVERYKDGRRAVFHRTAKLAFTHPDDDEARAGCEICAEAEKSPERKPHRLDLEAELLLARVAEPAEFDELRKRGWPGIGIPASQSLAPCQSSCGVCFPTAEITMAAHRRNKRGRK
jgi:hypothetical protein